MTYKVWESTLGLMYNNIGIAYRRHNINRFYVFKNGYNTANELILTVYLQHQYINA